MIDMIRRIKLRGEVGALAEVKGKVTKLIGQPEFTQFVVEVNDGTDHLEVMFPPFDPSLGKIQGAGYSPEHGEYLRNLKVGDKFHASGIVNVARKTVILTEAKVVSKCVPC